MHELALMTSVVDRVCEIARAEGAERITDIHIKCGALSGVIPEALEFCFDVCVAETIARDAALHIHPVPAAWRCPQCRQTTDRLSDNAIPLCPACGSPELQITSGREFEIESIEIE